MEEEDQADQGDDQALLDELLAQCGDRPVDQVRAVIHGVHHDTGREAGGDLGKFLLDALDGRARILAEPHHDDAADGFPAPIQFGDAAPHPGADGDATQLGHADRRAAGRGGHHHVLDVRERLEVAGPAHHVLTFRELHHHRAHVGVRGLHGTHHLRHGETVGEHPRRIEVDLVLLLEPADGGDLGDAGYRREGVPQVPVLHAAQVGETQPPRRILERVLVDPPEPRGIGPERRRDIRRQLAGDPAQVLEHAAARPVEVGPVLEDDVDERDAEERVAPHRRRARHLEHLGGDGIRDLVFDDARRLLVVLRLHDHLHVGEIGERLERCASEGPDAAGDRGRGGEDDQQRIRDRPADEAFQHDGILMA